MNNIPQLPPQSQLPPDLAGQLSQLQMRQQLAQALLGESMKPIDPARTAGRYVVPISPLEGLSKLGSTYLNAKNMTDATSGMAGIYAQANQRRNAAVQENLSPKEALSGALTSNDLPPGPWSPEMQDQNRQQSSQQPQQRGRETLQDIYAEASKIAPAYGTDVLTILDNPLYKARIESALKDRQLTDAQKNFSDPKTFADWQMKETHIMPIDLKPGGTALDPMTRQPFFTAPQDGIFTTWDKGSPTAQQIPNAFDLQAQQKEKESAAKAKGEFPYGGHMVVKNGREVWEFNPNLPGAPQSGLPQPAATPAQPAQVSGQVPQAQQPKAAMPFSTPPAQPPVAPAPVVRAAPQGDVQAKPLGPQLGGGKPIADPWQTMPKIQEPQGYGMTPYQKGTSENQAKAALEMTNKYGEVAAQGNQRKAFNDQALSLVDSADTGYGAAKYAEVRNALHRIFPSMGFDPSDTVALQKDLVNAATQKAKQQFGARITQSEVMLMLQKAAPNADMPKAAIKYLLNSDNAQLDYQTQQANDLNRYLSQGGDPQKFESWYAKAFPLTKALSGVHLEQPKGAPAKQSLQTKQVQRTGTLNGRKLLHVAGRRARCWATRADHSGSDPSSGCPVAT